MSKHCWYVLLSFIQFYKSLFFAPVKADKKVVKLVAAPCGWEAGVARHMTRYINKLFYLYEIMKKIVNYLFLSISHRLCDSVDFVTFAFQFQANIRIK